MEGGAGDKIDFGQLLSDFESGSPVGIVDVGQQFDPRNNSGGGWQWIPDGEGGAVPVPAGQAMANNPMQPSMMGNQVYEDIQKAIMQPAPQGNDNQLLQYLQMLLSQGQGQF